MVCDRGYEDFKLNGLRASQRQLPVLEDSFGLAFMIEKK